MSHDFKALARQYSTSVWGHHDLSIIDDLFCDSFSITSPTGITYQGDEAKDYLKKINSNWIQAFPGLEVTWDSDELNGNTVTHHWHAEGIHENTFTRFIDGEQVEYPAKGAKIQYAGESQFTFNGEGKVVAYKAALEDMDTFYQQLSSES